MGQMSLLYAPLIGGSVRGHFDVIPGSSVVEQSAVNRLVAGSNPARGATFDATQKAASASLCGLFLFVVPPKSTFSD